MDFIQTAINLFHQHVEIISFLGAFFGGSSVTLFFASVAGQQHIFPLSFIIFASLGNFLSDLAWFFLGKGKLVNKTLSFKHVDRSHKKMNLLLQKYEKKQWWLFIIIKFLYGLRILALIYFGSIHYRFKKFAQYNFPAVLIINTVIIFCGWMAGKGVSTFLNAFESFKTITLFVIIVFCFYYILRFGITRIVKKEVDEEVENFD